MSALRSPAVPVDRSQGHALAARPALSMLQEVVAARVVAAAGQPRLAKNPRGGVGPRIDLAEEMAHWAAVHAHQRFTTSLTRLEDFLPAYRLGVEQFLREPFRGLVHAEAEMARRWPGTPGSSLPWKVARFAARVAWERSRRLAFEEAR